jgi:hypothetical protein
VQASVQDRDVVPAIDEAAHDRDAGRTGAPDDKDLHWHPQKQQRGDKALIIGGSRCRSAGCQSPV